MVMMKLFLKKDDIMQKILVVCATLLLTFSTAYAVSQTKSTDDSVVLNNTLSEANNEPAQSPTEDDQQLADSNVWGDTYAYNDNQPDSEPTNTDQTDQNGEYYE